MRTPADQRAFDEMRQLAIEQALEREQRARLATSGTAVNTLGNPRPSRLEGERHLRYGSSFVDGSGPAPEVLPILDKHLALCTPEQNAFNRQWIQPFYNLATLAAAPGNYVDTFTDASNDLETLRRLCAQHDAAVFDFSYYSCSPSFEELDVAYSTWARAFNRSQERMRWGIPKIYGNADRELQELSRRNSRVADTRRLFETRPDGGDGVDGINARHAEFLTQESVLRAFQLWTINVDGTHYDATRFMSQVDELHRLEMNISVITELDLLRNEYRAFGRPVPLPAAFTQNESTQHFTFSDLNTGDYNWALLRPILLQKIEDIWALLTQASIPVQVNSVYRNPARADGLSRHQYGDAVDLQVFDLDHDGDRTAEWEQLAQLVAITTPSFMEPMSDSGDGHVHADYRDFNAHAP